MSALSLPSASTTDTWSASVTAIAADVALVMVAPSSTSRTTPSSELFTTTWPSSVPVRRYVPGAVIVTVPSFTSTAPESAVALEPLRVTATSSAASHV